jgi:hypothetical protein
MQWAYPVLLSVMMGAIWVDQMYAARIGLLVSAGGREQFFSGIADNLLLLVFATFVAGVIAAIRASGRTRWLLVGSLAVLSLQVLLPMVLNVLPGGATLLHGMGSAVRLVIVLVALGVAINASRRVTP